jgi:TatD DNase family protein
MQKNISFIDSHAHLSLLPEEEIEAILLRAKQNGVERIINVCIDPAALEQGLSLAQKYPWISLAAATTPHDALKNGDLHFSFFSKAAKEKKIVAIGETGLDFHHYGESRESQKKLLVRYFHLGTECDLPLIFHCREAFRELLDLAKSEYKSRKALLHCFTGSKSEAKEALDMGWMISFSGIISFAKTQELKEVANYVPLDRLLIETDAPYLAPTPHRGKRNEPSFLPEVARALASVRGDSIENIANATRENALSFFAL